MTDRKEYTHHTVHLTNTSRHYKTINKTTNKNGLGAIISHARGPTGHLLLNNQCTHPANRTSTYPITLNHTPHHYFSHTIHLSNTSFPYKTINRNTYKNGSGAIKYLVNQRDMSLGPMSVCLPLSTCVCLYPSLTVCLCLSLPVSVYLCLSVCMPACLWLTICLSVCLH